MLTAIKTSLILAVAAATLVVAPGLGASKPKPKPKPVPIAGKWAGDVLQGVDFSYQTKVRIRGKLVKNRRGGSVNYPEFHCGGKLVYLKRKNKLYYFHEKLSFGLDQCDDGGLVKVKRVGKTLSFLWINEDPLNPYTAIGTLSAQP